MGLIVLGVACSHRPSRHAIRTSSPKQATTADNHSYDANALVTDESSWGSPQLYEQIFAVVDKDVVTYGELVAEAKLALVERHGAALAHIEPERSFLESFSEFLVGQMLIAREARRMGSDEVTEDEIDARLVALRDRFSSMETYGAFVASLEMGPSFVRDVLARNMRNERYTQQRLRTRMLGAELRRHAEQGQPPVDDAKDSGAQRQQARRSQMLRSWLTDLRQAVDIQILGDDGVLHAESSR